MKNNLTLSHLKCLLKCIKYINIVDKLRGGLQLLLCSSIFIFAGNNVFAVDSQKHDTKAQAAVLYKQGITKYKTGEFYPAMDLFLQVLLLEPQNNKASRYLKKAVEKMLEPERLRIKKESEEIYKRAQAAIAKKEKKFDIKKQYRLAVKNCNKGYYLWATDKLNDVVKINPDYENAKKYLTEIKEKMNDIVRKDSLPDAKKFYYAKGYVFYQNKTLSEAVNFWERVLTIDPSNEEIKEYYTTVKENLRELAEIERIEKLFAELKEIYTVGEAKYIEKQYVGAIRSWENVVNKSSDEKDARLIQLNQQAEDSIGKAVEQLRKGSAVKPAASPASAPSAPVEEFVAQKDKAEEHYKKGLINYAQGRIGVAVRDWELALRYDPENKKIQKAIEKAKMELNLEKN